MSSGQVSIEALLLALIILTMSIAVLSYYTSIQNSSTAMELLKAHVLGQLGGLDGAAFIEKIDYSTSGSAIILNLHVKGTVTRGALDLNGAEDLIEEKTDFEDAEIKLFPS